MQGQGNSIGGIFSSWLAMHMPLTVKFYCINRIRPAA